MRTEYKSEGLSWQELVRLEHRLKQIWDEITSVRAATLHLELFFAQRHLETFSPASGGAGRLSRKEGDERLRTSQAYNAADRTIVTTVRML